MSDKPSEPSAATEAAGAVDPADVEAMVGNLADVRPEDFAALIAGSSKKKIAGIVEGPLRKAVLDEIFARMAKHVDPARARNTDAVVHFKILDRPKSQGGGYDHYEVVFANGKCKATDSPQREPNATIKVPAVEFLKLACNEASGPTLFLTGKLKLEGDLMLASRLTTLFRIPTAA